MRSELFFCLVIISFKINYLHGQIYTPLPDSNVVWNLDLVSINCPPPTGYCYSVSVSIIKDTVIGGINYHLTNHPQGGAGSGLIPAFRQDIINKKVYFPYETSFGSGVYVDTLLFDYSMNIGDSIVDLIDNNAIYYKVLSIDSIYNGSQYLKRFTIGNQFPTCTWLEGIGNTYGLFGFMYAFETTFQLICVKKDNQTIFPFNTNSCIPVPINGIEKNKIIRLNPNILTSGGNIRIENTEMLYEDFNIYITDYSGNSVDFIKPNTAIFSTAGLQPGLYIVTVIANQNKQVLKLIIF